MDIFLAISGLILTLSGLIGCIVPVIPGPPLNFIGLLLLHFTRYADFSKNFLFLFGAITLVVTVFDYIVPIWGAKKFGGSKAGVRGSVIGLIMGTFFFPPIGIVLGPLVGAIAGESIAGKNFSIALKAGIGSLVGFLMGTGLKLAASGVMTFYFVKNLILKI